MRENRKTTRLSWNKQAKVIQNNKYFNCTINELSLKNALLTFEKNINFNVNEKLSFMLHLTNKSESHLLETSAVIKRIASTNQIAIEFYSLSLDSYITLQDILSYNFGGDSVIINDLKLIFSNYVEE